MLQWITEKVTPFSVTESGRHCCWHWPISVPAGYGLRWLLWWLWWRLFSRQLFFIAARDVKKSLNPRTKKPEYCPHCGEKLDT